jgi:hypothetical protein
MIDSTTCVLCDAKCETDVSLDFHVKTIHQRLFVCTKCPAYTTMIRAKLKRHLETEHNQVPAKLGPATREDVSGIRNFFTFKVWLFCPFYSCTHFYSRKTKVNREISRHLRTNLDTSFLGIFNFVIICITTY